jgi:hypothetical protein
MRFKLCSIYASKNDRFVFLMVDVAVIEKHGLCRRNKILHELILPQEIIYQRLHSGGLEGKLL